MKWLVWTQATAGTGLAFVVNWSAALTGVGLCVVGLTAAKIWVVNNEKS